MKSNINTLPVGRTAFLFLTGAIAATTTTSVTSANAKPEPNTNDEQRREADRVQCAQACRGLCRDQERRCRNGCKSPDAEETCTSKRVECTTSCIEVFCGGGPAWEGCGVE